MFYVAIHKTNKHNSKFFKNTDMFFYFILLNEGSQMKEQ